MNYDSEEYYGHEFYSDILRGSARSAEVVMPIVLNMLNVSSLVDVGCGQGAWAKAAINHGTEIVHGIDGSWLPKEALLLPSENFFEIDLNTSDIVSGSGLHPRYDLAICLEVAEHLPKATAKPLVDFLTTIAPVCLFSAAIPGQGGIGHLNEQWPEYWAQLFDGCAYRAYDPLRRSLWNDERVEPWYVQNTFLFAGELVDHRPIQLMEERNGTLPSRLVHPRIYQNALEVRDGPWEDV